MVCSLKCAVPMKSAKSHQQFLHAIDLTSTSKMSGGYTGAFFRYDFGKGLKSKFGDCPFFSREVIHLNPFNNKIVKPEAG